VDVPLRETWLFAALKAAALIFLFGGIALNVSFWLAGPWARGESLARSRLARGGALAGELARRLFSTRGLRVLVLDVLLQRQVLEKGAGRWLIHLGFSLGFAELFLIGSLGLYLADLGLVGLEKDTPWFAFLNDFSGLVLVAGAAGACARRFVLKAPQLKSDYADRLLMVLLGLIVLTGFLLEGARLARDGVAWSAARYSFVGVGFSGLWPTGQAASRWYAPLWWSHAALSLAFVAWLPFTKLFHLFASPLSLFLNDREARSEPPPAIPVPLDTIHREARKKEATARAPEN
jgi:nitrate reductase gamma subunit